ncbi:Chloramphenicol acetyltransferase-like domain [Phytophthora cactorum]|nr:Chloramphenicol acetyltransferase-like domain [Phytophthora cactorum]
MCPIRTFALLINYCNYGYSFGRYPAAAVAYGRGDAQLRLRDPVHLPSVILPYDLKKLQSSFLSLVEQDYPILIGELYVDPRTGIVNVKQTAESRLNGAAGIQFETNPRNPMTTEQAIQMRSWDLIRLHEAKLSSFVSKGRCWRMEGWLLGSMLATRNGGIAEDAASRVSRCGGNWGERSSPSLNSSAAATTHQLFHFTPKMMKKIKEVATHSALNGDVDVASYVSTVDAITALFTVLISRARGHDQDVRITTGVNARRLLDPPLPENYVGNVIFNAFSAYANSELQPDGKEKGVSPVMLGKLARRVRESILQRNDAYLRDAMSFLTEQSDVAAVQVGTNFVFGPDLMFTSWLHMGMHKPSLMACILGLHVLLNCHATMDLLWSLRPKKEVTGSSGRCTAPAFRDGCRHEHLSRRDSLHLSATSVKCCAFDLKKLQRSFVTLVNEDYPILVGELHVDGKAISVKQTPQARQQGGSGIRFETSLVSAQTTNDAIDLLSWEFMPKPRAQGEILAVKGSILTDGGMAIGVDCSHVLFDGEAMLTFMRVSKDSDDTTKNDQHVFHLSPSNMAMLKKLAANVPETGKTRRSQRKRERFPAKLLSIFRSRNKKVAQAQAAPRPSYVSSLDAVTALFTVLISQARGHGKTVRVSTAVNGRNRLEPPLPANYSGNAVFHAVSSYTNEELQVKSNAVAGLTLSRVARGVRASILDRDNAFMRDTIAFISNQSDPAAINDNVNFFFGPDVAFTCWAKMGLYDAEFDGVKPWYAKIPRVQCMDGFVLITEALKGDDGLDVLVCLESTTMEILKELCANVEYIQDQSETT